MHPTNSAWSCAGSQEEGMRPRDEAQRTQRELGAARAESGLRGCGETGRGRPLEEGPGAWLSRQRQRGKFQKENRSLH